MGNKCLVVSCRGLGDGVISLILSNNLYLNKNEVITFHNEGFSQLQRWFSHLPIKKFPEISAVRDIVKDFDQIFVFYDRVDPFIQALIREGKTKFPNKIKVLNPCFSRSEGNQPYYEDSYFRRDISIVDNIDSFCRNVLKLQIVTKSNGIKCPYDLIFRKNISRVVIHPTSAKKGRSWLKEKFIDLYGKLKKRGFSPSFVMSKNEMEAWSEGVTEEIDIEGFDSFDDLAKYVYQAGYFIGNDSGVAHLASAFGIPVLCISRSKRTTDLWRPGWGKVIVIYPSTLIPNISGFRLRDKKWKFFISTNRVLKNFLKIVDSKHLN
jgi:heptosyltransferase III